MNAGSLDEKTAQALQGWNRALWISAWLGIVWSVYTIVDTFLGPNFAIALRTTTGLKVLTATDFTPMQRAIAAGLLIPGLLCWVYCLWQIVLLAGQFSKGEILSTGMVHCLERFGLGIACQGVAEALLAPTLIAYLRGIEKVDSIQNMWEHIIGGGALSSMMAAFLIVIIARILRIGIQLRKDAELTI